MRPLLTQLRTYLGLSIMYKRFVVWLSATSLISLISVTVVIAQVCSGIVFQALEAVEQNCSGIGRNQACYGFDQVEASFLGEVGISTFSQPTDIAAVSDIKTIRTAPLNLDSGVWGVAIMSLQANMPDMLPGQNVTFILMGDVEVENAVAPEDAFDPNDGIEVVVSVIEGANIRSGPNTNFNIIGGAANNVALQADGLSEDGAWLRIAYRERPAWISLSTIEDNSAIAELPTLTSELFTPMQAIYLRTGIGEPECGAAPDDILLVQGPENITISLNVNGADVTLGSSGAFRVVEIDGELFLEVIVFDGEFVVGGVTIRPGQSSLLCLGSEGNRGLDGSANDRTVECVNPPQPIDPDEFGQEWCVLEDLPSTLLNYGIEVLCPGETAPATGGETPSGTTASEIEGVDCSTFSIPPQAIPATNFTLSWNAAQGADNYIVAILDGGGFEVSNYSTAATSIGLNGGVGFPNGGSIHVRAYQGGQYACVATIGFSRTPDPNEPPGGYGGAGDITLVSCQGVYSPSFTWNGSITWSNAGPSATITVKAGEGSPANVVATGSGVSGSLSFSQSGTFYDDWYIEVIVSSGGSASFTCPSPGV
jgi:hypothetical protein